MNKKIIFHLIFIGLYLLIVYSPIFYVHFSENQTTYNSNKRIEYYNECYNEKRNIILDTYHINVKKSKISSDDLNDIIDNAVVGICTNHSITKSKLVKYDILFIVTIFILIPFVGLFSLLSEKLLKAYTKDHMGSKFIMKFFLILLIYVIISLSGFSIVWYLCLQSVYIPKTIEILFFISGAPLIGTIIALVEAFGKAKAHSGVSTQNLFSKFNDS